jgi:ribosomal protein L37AE/L43A
MNGLTAADKPSKAKCPKCNQVSKEFERLSGGHWYFWCDNCKDHIAIPTEQYLERKKQVTA